MRTVKEPDERKREILDAAVRVFTRKGYEKTSIADIAREIGISQGLCYRYYASKEAIYDAALDKYAAYIVEQDLARAKACGATLREQILHMSGQLKGYVAAERGETDLYALFHQEGNHRMHDELFLRVSEKLVPFLTRMLEAANERGEIAVADPKASAYFLVYGQMGLLMSHAYPEEEAARTIQRCLFEMLKLDPS